MKKRFVLAFLVIICAYLVSSAFNYNSENLVKVYSAGETIRGTINISFSNTPGDSLFKSNLPGSISVLDLLRNNSLSSNSYNCSIPGCQEDYAKSNVVSSLFFEDEAYVGFALQGQSLVDVQNIQFRIQSNAAPSCFRQTEIDLLADGNSITSNRYADETCFDQKWGCFQPNLSSYQLANIPSNGEYCEKINLPVGPAYKVGANITKIGSPTTKVFMRMYDINGVDIGECTLPGFSGSSKFVECIIPYSSTVNQDYFVCVNAEQENTYRIRTETNQPCGTSNFGDTYPIDYEISAKNLKFGSVDLTINEDNFEQLTGESLRLYVLDYINDKYNGQCTNECIVPVKVSGEGQTLTFTNVQAVYDIDGAQGLESNNLYEIEESAPKITSGQLILDISDANFQIPYNTSTNRFKLNLAGQQILDVPINVSESFYFDISPKFVAFGQEATFTATSGNVTSTWDFGDGTIINSQDNKATHRYLEEGEFTIQVTLKKGGQTARRSFTIIVGDAKEIANITIKDYYKRIGNLRTDLQSMDQWVSDEISKDIDLVDINNSLFALEKLYNEANDTGDYQQIMLQLIELNVPKSIEVVESGNLPISIGFEDINTEYIEEISARKTEDKESLKNSIINWILGNYKVSVEYDKIAAIQTDDQEIIATKFKVVSEPLGSENPVFLIIGKPVEEIRFKTNYGERNIKGGTYITLKGQKEEFELLVHEELNVNELATYVSPEVNVLGDFEPILQCNFNSKCESIFGENRENCPEDCRPWGWFIVWLFVILFLALIAYVFMQEWYKRNYEKSLFRNKDDLYNIINFIYNARTQGLEGKAITKKLAEIGWTHEQINYAMKKIDGKRTGMFEIPVLSLFEHKKVIQEIEKRQNKPVDARFIKRPDLT